MSQANSALKSIINQYTKQFVDRISELERENEQLKQKVSSFSPNLKTDFDRLTERHTELKSSYAEIERENTQLRQDMELLISQQKSLETDIENHFQHVFTTLQPQQYQTPKKSFTVEMPKVVPSQKPIHREAKATTKLLNTAYESDSELDSSDDEMPELVSDSANEQEKLSPRKLRFADDFVQDPNKSFMAGNTTPVQSGSNSNTINLSSVLPNDEYESDDDVDDYESILKHIITEGLMSGLENMNRSPHANKSTRHVVNPRNETRMGNKSRIQVPTGKKTKRHQFHKSQAQQFRQAQQNNQGQQNNQAQQPNANNTTGHNMDNFPFRFMFSPQTGQMFTNPNTNPTQPAQMNSNTNSNASPGQNPLNPSSQEVQLVQKILESLFNPPAK